MRPFDTIDWESLAQEELSTGNLAPVLADLSQHFSSYHANGPVMSPFEKLWLEAIAAQLGIEYGDHVLDIGSGYAPIADCMRFGRYDCVETEPACVNYLNHKGFFVFPSRWMDCASLPLVDHVLCIRALGVVSLNSQNRLCLTDSLKKMTACARKKVHIVMRNFRFYEPLEAELRGLSSGFAKDPYLYPVPLLFQLGYTPDLKWFTWTRILEFKDWDEMFFCELQNSCMGPMDKGVNQELAEYLKTTSQIGLDGKVLRVATYKNYILQWGKTSG